MIFAVCGGDERLVRLSAQLLRDGHRVRLFALEGAPAAEGARSCAAAAEAVAGADCVVLPMPALSEHYVEAGPGDCDLRAKHGKGPALLAEPYVQVFADRLPFAANLSAVDLLFAEGPGSVSVLTRCRQGS